MKIGKDRQKLIVIALMCLFAVIFCVSAFLAVSGLLEARRSAGAFDALRGRLERPSGADARRGEETRAPAEAELTEEERLALLLESYAALKEENPDFYGWLTVPDTVVDYPVMYTPSNPERYLRRAFDGSYSTGGVPFIDGACYEGCGNLIIYGHHMRNGTMFTDLLQYADRSFWAEHPTLRFDTPEGTGEYEVLAAFYSKVYYSDETGVFRYYRYADVSDPGVFSEYVSQVRSAALYDTGVDARPGDELLTLSTCSDHTDNGRFVVVARKIA